MVTTWLAQQPPPAAEHSGAGGYTFLVLAALAWVVYKFIKAQVRPLTRCESCPKPDAEGNRKRCRRCGDKSEVLNRWAYAQMKLGIPVPRARRLDKVHPRAVPRDW